MTNTTQQKENVEIRIIHEDDDIIVIDKPAGITVNKADTTVGEMTVQDWSEAKLKDEGLWKKDELRETLTDTTDPYDPVKAFYDRGGIVHRLDKETSGILLLAKHTKSFIELQRQFKERIVKKTYLALAHGNVIPREGEIRVPVGRLPWNRKQFGVVAGGREALTRYKVISNFKFQKSNEIVSLVELYPETGRTHQIRVHLKYLGYPIFADFLYAGRKTQRDDRKMLGRVFLHAARLTFLHPQTAVEMTYESQLPSELQHVIDLLQSVHL